MTKKTTLDAAPARRPKARAGTSGATVANGTVHAPASSPPRATRKTTTTTATDLVRRSSRTSTAAPFDTQPVTPTDEADLSLAGGPDPLAAPIRPAYKLATLVRFLQQADGASLNELALATGWQVHSIRGAMAGALRKKGYTIVSQRTDHGRRYRIVAASS